MEKRKSPLQSSPEAPPPQVGNYSILVLMAAYSVTFGMGRIAATAPAQLSSMSAFARPVNTVWGLTSKLAIRAEASSQGGVQNSSSKEDTLAGVEAILQQAQAALNAERIEEAVEQCYRALQVDPNSAHAYYLLAVVEARRGARKEALQALLQAAKLDPSDVAVHLDLGKLYLQVDDHASATREFRRAIELGDPSGKGDYGLALVMIAKSRFGDALPHLRVAAGANPKDPERLLTLAATQLQLLQIAGSRETLRQIEDLPAPDPWFLYRLGNLLRDAKIPNAAQSAYERAIATLETPKGRASQDSRRPDLYLQAARLCFNHHD